MTFDVTLYLSKEEKEIGYPIEDKGKYKQLSVYSGDDFLYGLTNYDNAKFSDDHECREVAVRKTLTYAQYRNSFGSIFISSFLEFTSSNVIPETFKPLLKETLLNKYGLTIDPMHTNDHTSMFMDLEGISTFNLGAYVGEPKIHWLSLLTYFVKYGEFLEDLVGWGKGEVGLDETIPAILDSWSGEVGFHTALGLWLFAMKPNEIVHVDSTWCNGIHQLLAQRLTIDNPHWVFEFIDYYSLGIDRVSKKFIDIHKPRINERGFNLPWWYERGSIGYGSFSDSPEWASYMGFDEDEDNDYEEGYYDEDYYDFEEEW